MIFDRVQVPALTRGNFILIHTSAPNLPVQLQGSIRVSRIVSPLASHPITQGLAFGDVNVRRFTLELRPKLSIWGKEWVDSTRGLLQSAIENLRDADPEAFDRLEQDDKAFTKFAFDSHPRAYIQGGLATVTDDDAVMIMKFAGDQASLKHIVVTGVPFLDQRGQLNNNWRFGMKRQFDMARACAMCPFPGRP